MRLEAKIKSGYYPLPLEAVPSIAEKIKVSPDTTIYDPCAGRGDAVIAIAEALGIKHQNIYATELDHGRHASLKEKLGERAFEPCDFLADRIWGTPSIVYCNPPFDDELGGGGRVEWRFIQKSLDLLDPGGLLVAILPWRVVNQPNTVELTTPWAELVRYAPLECERKYGETLLIARKKKAKTIVRWIERADIPCKLAEMPTYETIKGTGITARKRFFSQIECYDLAATTPANSILTAEERLGAQSLVPPMRLTHGHIALLLASGFLDGVVEMEGEEPHVVRGSARKVTTERKDEAGGAVKVVRTEQIQLTVKIADSQGVRILEDQIANKVEGEETEDEDKGES